MPINYDRHGVPMTYDRHGVPMDYGRHVVPMTYGRHGVPVKMHTVPAGPVRQRSTVFCARAQLA